MKTYIILATITAIFFCTTACAARAEDIVVRNTGTAGRIGPGDTLPFSMQLLNFGSDARADVSITYRIYNSAGETFYTSKETVAVETTASFVKRITLPATIPSGAYMLHADLDYRGKTDPAESSFAFTVEPKFAGIFLSDAVRYALFALAALLLGIVLARALLRRSERRFVAHDYSDKPKKERVYYEIVSDAIAGMRLHAGDDALAIAARTPDLKINTDTGRVLSIGAHPDQILASLVLRYETLLGRGVKVARR